MFCVLTMILRVPPCPAIMHQDVDLDRRSKTPITDDDMQDVAAALDFFVAKGVDSVSGTAPPALAETDQKSSRLLVLVRGVCGVGRGGCHRYLAALLPCYLATLLLCQLAILPSCHATLPFCYLASAILLSCYLAILRLPLAAATDIGAGVITDMGAGVILPIAPPLHGSSCQFASPSLRYACTVLMWMGVVYHCFCHCCL